MNFQVRASVPPCGSFENKNFQVQWKLRKKQYTTTGKDFMKSYTYRIGVDKWPGYEHIFICDLVWLTEFCIGATISKNEFFFTSAS